MFKLLFQTKTTDTSKSTDVEGIGRYRFSDDGRVYRWIKNNDTVTLNQGDVCFHKYSDGADQSTATSSSIGRYVYQCLTANLGIMAGIVTTTSGIAAGQFGWIQIFGENLSVSVSGATTGGTDIAAGDYLKGKNVSNYLIRDTATSPTYNRSIQALVAIPTTTTPAAALTKGFIDCF